MAEEFRVKQFTLVLFLMASYSYLGMTLVRGKGSLPLCIQIPTCLGYTIMVVLAKVYGKQPKNHTIFNMAIPSFVLSMFFPNIAFTTKEAYESEVVWAFCLCTIFTLFQMFALLYGLKFKMQVVISLIGLTCMVTNIERQSSYREALRMETYPYLIGCVIASNYI
jgi:CDP-diglyceride synthetase